MLHCTGLIKGEMTKCGSYRDLSLLKTHAGILVDRVHRVIEGLVGGEQGYFRSEGGVCKSNIHPKGDWGESTREKTFGVCIFNGFREGV